MSSPRRCRGRAPTSPPLLGGPQLPSIRWPVRQSQPKSAEVRRSPPDGVWMRPCCAAFRSGSTMYLRGARRVAREHLRRLPRLVWIGRVGFGRPCSSGRCATPMSHRCRRRRHRSAVTCAGLAHQHPYASGVIGVRETERAQPAARSRVQSIVIIAVGQPDRGRATDSPAGSGYALPGIAWKRRRGAAPSADSTRTPGERLTNPSVSARYLTFGWSAVGPGGARMGREGWVWTW
jgi:hypothetical protein